MEVLGLLRIRVIRGIKLAVRDALSSDPYCVITCDNQKVRTKVVKRKCNPIWNEELTIYIKDEKDRITLFVYDKDMFSGDDRMGYANIDITTLIECIKMGVENLPDGTIVERVQPTQDNCLADESCVVWNQGKLTQDMCLKLQKVERGEVEIQIEWIDIPGTKGLEIQPPKTCEKTHDTSKVRTKRVSNVITVVSTARKKFMNKTIGCGTKSFPKHSDM